MYYVLCGDIGWDLRDLMLKWSQSPCIISTWDFVSLKKDVVLFDTVVGTGNTTHERPNSNPTEEGNVDREEEPEDHIWRVLKVW